MVTFLGNSLLASWLCLLTVLIQKWLPKRTRRMPLDQPRPHALLLDPLSIPFGILNTSNISTSTTAAPTPGAPKMKTRSQDTSVDTDTASVSDSPISAAERHKQLRLQQRSSMLNIESEKDRVAEVTDLALNKLDRFLKEGREISVVNIDGAPLDVNVVNTYLI